MSTDTLRAEFQILQGIDSERATLDARQHELAAQRERQIGRLEILAEQAGVDLAEFVGAELTDQP